MGHFLQFVLNVNLQLHDALGVSGIFDLLGDFAGFNIEPGLEEALGVVEFVLGDVGVELGQLIVHVRCVAVVLDVEVTVGQQGESRAGTGLELQLVVQNLDHLTVFAVTDEGVDGLSVLTVGDRSESGFHFTRRFKMVR